MAQVQGRRRSYYTTHERDGTKRTENECFTCGHCQHVTILDHQQKIEDAGSICKMCMRPVCEICTTHARCDPFERKLERAEARARSLASMGL